MNAAGGKGRAGEEVIVAGGYAARHSGAFPLFRDEPKKGAGIRGRPLEWFKKGDFISLGGLPGK